MSQKTLSRREALKALIAASAGITASSFLPSKWLKPVIQSGVLPVHAQTSVTYFLYGRGSIGAIGDGTVTVSNLNVLVSPVEINLDGSVQRPVGVPNVNVTFKGFMNADGADPVSNPTPKPPITKKTDQYGYANFDDVTFTFTGDFSNLHFFLIFTGAGKTDMVEIRPLT